MQQVHSAEVTWILHLWRVCVFSRSFNVCVCVFILVGALMCVLFHFRPVECSSHRSDSRSPHRRHSVPADHHQPRYKTLWNTRWLFLERLQVVWAFIVKCFELSWLPYPYCFMCLTWLRSDPAGGAGSKRDSVHHPAATAAHRAAAAHAVRGGAGAGHTAGIVLTHKTQTNKQNAVLDSSKWDGC